MRFERWKKAEEAVARKTQRFTLLSLIDLQLRDNILKGIGDFDKGISGARDSVRGYYSGGEE